MPDAKTVVKIEDLGKQYLLRHQSQDLLYNVLAEKVRGLGRRALHPFARRTSSQGPGNKNLEEFWALRNLSLNIYDGERVGVVGHNGAGKSTLLKLLSRITQPTEGRISIRGRIASLLEVGTGFHPELTGRENIYLNAAILGMSRSEIRHNFDAIVNFSGVEKFLDTPVKHYSSGMYVRLAFAIAAHLDSEILMVDEVLAVGDAEFQKKCMGKMDEVSHRQGRTIFFVSHNMGAVSRLCNRIICLDRGRLTLDTHDVSEGVKKYLSMSGEESATEWKNPGGMFGNPWFKPLRFGVYGEDGRPLSGVVERRDRVWVEIEGIVERPSPVLGVGYLLTDEDGTPLYWTFQTDRMGSPGELPVLNNRVCLRSPVPLEIFNLGEKKLELAVQLHRQEWLASPGKSPSISFRLGGVINSSPYCFTRREGYLAPDIPWSLITRNSPV